MHDPEQATQTSRTGRRPGEAREDGATVARFNCLGGSATPSPYPKCYPGLPDTVTVPQPSHTDLEE